jgi:hypothetical protein
MTDRRIGHQPFDVALSDCREGAERHRGDRNEHNDLLPFVGDARKCHDRRSREDGDASDLGRSSKESGDRRRRTLIDVGRPHVERHRGNLEAEADKQEH